MRFSTSIANQRFIVHRLRKHKTNFQVFIFFHKLSKNDFFLFKVRPSDNTHFMVKLKIILPNIFYTDTRGMIEKLGSIFEKVVTPFKNPQNAQRKSFLKNMLEK